MGMKFLLTLCLLGLVAGSEDYKMFMKWAKTKAMESCWGEDNMKAYTVNMKKAVAKCQQSDAPELDLPPFRAANRFVNNLVSMAGQREGERDQMESFMQFFKFSKMMEMMNSHKQTYDDDYSNSSNMMEKLKMMMMMKNMMGGQHKEEYGHSQYQNPFSKSSNYMKSQSQEQDLWKTI